MIDGVKAKYKGDISADTQLTLNKDADKTITLSINPLYYPDWNGIKYSWMAVVGHICLEGKCLDTAATLVSQVEQQYNMRVKAGLEHKANRRGVRAPTKSRGSRSVSATGFCSTKSIRRDYVCRRRK